MNDPYLDSATGVLRNKLNLADADLLQEAETRLSMVRDFEIARETVPGRYDLGHLRRFHRRLFGDVYPWAGQLRTVDIWKGSSYFCAAVHIEAYANERVFPRVVAFDYLRGLDRQSVITALAELLAEVNALHPFREGNGRTQRAFLRQLAGAAGWRLDWSNLSPTDNATACENAMRGDSALLEGVLDPVVIYAGS